jgi:hypothetical protein
MLSRRSVARLNARHGSRATALLLPSAGFWLILAAIATVAGVARERWLVPLLGDLRGHQVGTLLVTSAFLAAISMFVAWMKLSPSEALAIGGAWLLCAVTFEFGFGHYVDGLSWNRLLSDYDLSEGRLLLLLWLAVGAGPFAVACLQEHRAPLKYRR